jgi:hypothetical protein
MAEQRLLDMLLAFFYRRSSGHVELNPVRGRIVLNAEDYPYSSLKRPDMIDPRPPWFSGTHQG